MKIASPNWKRIRSVLQFRRGDTNDKLKRVIPYQAICDYAGREAQVAAFGEFITGQKRPDISIVWNYFINPDRTKQVLTGTGANSIDESRLKLAAAGGAGIASVESTRGIIYRTGHDAFTLFTCAFDTAKIGTTQKAGVWNGTNGFYISIEEDGQLAVNHLNGGELETVLQEDFNLDNLSGDNTCGSVFKANPQAMLVYRIMYGYLGQFPAFFEVYCGSEMGWVPFHVIDVVNIDNQLIIKDPYLPMKFEVTSDGTNDVAMYSGSWLGGVISAERDRSLNDHFSFAAPKTLVANVETIIGTMRVKETFQGKVNKIPIDFHNLTCSTDGNKAVIIRIYKNTPLTGPVWIDPLGANSVIEIDLTGTLAGTSPDEVKYTVALGRIDSLGPGKEFDTGELRLNPGETLTFTGFSIQASDILLAGQWDELK